MILISRNSNSLQSNFPMSGSEICARRSSMSEERSRVCSFQIPRLVTCAQPKMSTWLLKSLRMHSIRPKLGSPLRDIGFNEDTDEDANICSWKKDKIRVDVMPIDGEILGFSNRWYPGAVAHAKQENLGDTTIRIMTAPYFLATKIEAFNNRGEGDFAASRDLEDVMTIINGRPELIAELSLVDQDVRRFIQDSISALLSSEDFRNALPGLVEPGRGVVILGLLENIVKLN